MHLKPRLERDGREISRREFIATTAAVASGVFCAALIAGLQAATPAESFPTWRHLVSGSNELPSPNGGKEQTSLLVVDIDRDGLNDIVVASRSAVPALVWLRREKDRWSRHVIDEDKAPIAAGGTACDVNGDGHPDLIFGSSGAGGDVWWWENPGAHADPKTAWKRRIITNSQKGQHHDQLAGDFLGTGKPQIVSWYQGRGELVLFPIPPNPRHEPWPSVIEVSTGLPKSGKGNLGPEGLASGDIDGDGKLDIVGGGRWFKHQGGTRFSTFVIDEAQTPGRAAAGDLVEGGHPEVAMVIGDGIGRLKWYECSGNPTQAGAWQGHDLLGTDVDHGHSLQIADINGDGHLDVFCAEMTQWAGGANPNSKAWIFYGDGRGHFTKSEVATGIDFHEAKIADLNGDGRLDIVSKPFIWRTPRLDVWLNVP